MTHPKILVTGATGKTGAAVVTQLREQDWPVRAVVHRLDARSARLERLGAEVVVADLFDPDQLLVAMRGTTSAYYCPPFHPHALQSAAAFAAAARDARLEAIVRMGQWLSHRSHPAIMTRHTWLMDRMFAELRGISHTVLNPGMFADNFLRVIDFAALLGLYPILTGEGRAAPVANEDLARTAVAVLRAAPERHAGKTYRPTGPALLSGRDMAAVCARVVGHRVLPLHLPYWMFCKIARQQGIDPIQISVFRHYVEDMKTGAFEFGGGVTDVVERLTGTPAETFETAARRYATLPFARQTWGNRIKAFVNFNLTPLYPGYNLRRLERQWGFPPPARPTLAMEDQRWRDEHASFMANPPEATTEHGAGCQVATLVPLGVA